MVVAQGNDASEHQQTANRSIEYELDCRIDPAFTSPASDQEICRNQHQFPENIEEEEGGGKKNAGDTTLQKQHKGHIILDLQVYTESSRSAYNCKQRSESNK